MKKTMIMLLAMFSLTVAVPVFAAEMTKEQKNECLLASKACANAVDTIQVKVKKLQAEVKKGKVYSPDELKKLEAKLKEAEALLDSLMKPGQ